MLTTILFTLSFFIAMWMIGLIVIRAMYRQTIIIQLILAFAAWTAVITHAIHIW